MAGLRMSVFINSKKRVRQTFRRPWSLLSCIINQIVSISFLTSGDVSCSGIIMSSERRYGRGISDRAVHSANSLGFSALIFPNAVHWSWKSCQQAWQSASGELISEEMILWFLISRWYGFCGNAKGESHSVSITGALSHAASGTTAFKYFKSCPRMLCPISHFSPLVRWAISHKAVWKPFSPRKAFSKNKPESGRNAPILNGLSVFGSTSKSMIRTAGICPFVAVFIFRRPLNNLNNSFQDKRAVIIAQR